MNIAIIMTVVLCIIVLQNEVNNEKNITMSYYNVINVELWLWMS